MNNGRTPPFPFEPHPEAPGIGLRPPRATSIVGPGAAALPIQRDSIRRQRAKMERERQAPWDRGKKDTGELLDAEDRLEAAVKTHQESPSPDTRSELLHAFEHLQTWGMHAPQSAEAFFRAHARQARRDGMLLTPELDVLHVLDDPTWRKKLGPEARKLERARIAWIEEEGGPETLTRLARIPRHDLRRALARHAPVMTEEMLALLFPDPDRDRTAGDHPLRSYPAVMANPHLGEAERQAAWRRVQRTIEVLDATVEESIAPNAPDTDPMAPLQMPMDREVHWFLNEALRAGRPIPPALRRDIPGRLEYRWAEALVRTPDIGRSELIGLVRRHGQDTDVALGALSSPRANARVWEEVARVNKDSAVRKRFLDIPGALDVEAVRASLARTGSGEVAARLSVHPNDEVRALGRRLLVQNANPRAFKTLLEMGEPVELDAEEMAALLSHKDPNIRRSALEVLDRLRVTAPEHSEAIDQPSRESRGKARIR